MSLGIGPFEVTTDFVGRAATITVHGEVDICTSPRLWAGLIEAVEIGADRLVIDFADVDFIDASGLAVIAQALRCLPECGQLVVRSPTALVLRVFELTGLDGACVIEQ